MHIQPKRYRLWKLGSLEHKIHPTSEAVKRLSDLLMNAEGETVDIVWGPAISVQEIQVNSTVENIVVDSIVEDGDKVTITAHRV